MTPWLQDADVTLYRGDVLETLRELPAESVDCIVTSPPYWGLRDYGTPGQLGLEPTPEQYVERMVEVFREVRRVLASHGTVWLNLGDSFAASGYSNHANTGGAQREDGGKQRHLTGSGLKPKDLVGIPWRVAFALQADGWWLRSAITWCKPNCMPESVTDRPTKATEMVFLLTKASRYYYDAEALREEAKWERWGDQTVIKPQPGTASWIGNRTKVDLLAGRTNGAATGGATLRPELRATLSTDDGTTDTWGWCDLGEFEVAVASPMASETQCLQVLKSVGFQVGVEAPEGPLVVDLDRAGFTASDAAMPVALASGLSLLSPVWASVVDAAPAPSGAVLTDHVGCDPTTAALARAEVTSLQMTRVAGDWLAAEVTLKSEELGATLLVWGTPGATHPRNTTEPAGRNARDWWVIPTQPYPEAHFATFPEELARRCIAAGCPERVCRVCGKARERIVSASYDAQGRTTNGPRSLEQRHETAGFPVRKVKTTSTEGFTDCDHGDHRPGVVLDPFIGSGTVCYVARKLGRHAVGIDLSAEYLALAARRLQQQSLFAEAL